MLDGKRANIRSAVLPVDNYAVGSRLRWESQLLRLPPSMNNVLIQDIILKSFSIIQGLRKTSCEEITYLKKAAKRFRLRVDTG